MTINFAGLMSNDAKGSALTAALITPSHIYLGFTTVAIAATDTLASITESTAFARTEITSNLAAELLVGGIPTVQNSTAITTVNAGSSGEKVVGFFLTTVASAASGAIIAYGNYASGVYSNSGQPLTVAIDGLQVQIN